MSDNAARRDAVAGDGKTPARFAGKIALVTGAGQGIGAAVAAALAAEGAAVAAVDLDPVRVEAVAAEHRTRGAEVRAYPADVSHGDAVDRVVERVENDLGPIDVLVNVAGVLRAGTVLKSTDDDWLSTFAVNSDGVFFVSRAVARRMVPRAAGVIVTVGSNAAGVPRMEMAAYAASKAAATMFTRCLGLELAAHGIRCNVVSPGSTDTAMQRALWTGDGARRVIEGSPESFRVGIPLGRIAESADVADAVLFLASDQARHITMQNLYVDGGATLVG
ncbi:2,3-dihydro-2,3-dihydroxybenzoate dehydrogenase [Actinokineospora globicatena]|uniref:2,3-dihydro-2,3-dihydroxybenzoate dehydrogenase n=1 Tax=Actinokineospora globicatena TaxID=103729 RepID=A0A9W6QPW4_9PSEU|nr:2,3-dihydro-2,3-dihydroxybenzoate dehydrogenase [Actinokineospora globicatena]GLW93507.1 2,3-dihydro-2,3-dihydroxybenzoate dehydrogenase [Actinokineospora globicatena]